MIGIFKKINTRKQLKNELLEYVNDYNFLEKGNYLFIFSSKPCLCKKGFEKYVYKDQRKRMVDGHILGKSYSFTNGDDFFCAQALMKLKNGRYKFFNYKEGYVLNTSMKNLELDNIIYLSNYFLTTFIKNTTNGFVEKYIDYIPREQWDKKETELLYKRIIIDYINYAKVISNDIEMKSIDFVCDVDELKDVYNYVLLHSYTKTVPCVFTHGDLSFYNILYDREEKYYIDFADSRIEAFFYDVFNVMYVDFIFGNTSLLLDVFLSDDDKIFELFSDLFFCFHADGFERQKRRDYLYSYILLRMNYDIRKSSKQYSNEELSSYYHELRSNYSKFIKYIESK